MFIPTREAILHMSPTDFERYSLLILSEQCSGLDNVVIQHNQIMETDDGNYQIDGYVEFQFMDLTYKTIVECKHYKTSISREKVQVLFDKIRAVGAHKGILISSSNFQSGAIEYASKHGIALVQLTEAGTQYETRQLLDTTSIMDRPNVPYNHGFAYVGVMQYINGTGINCSYLSRVNQSLREFLIG